MSTPFSMTLILQTRSEEIVELMYMSYIRHYGFLQVYQLQTENDEEETWKDLVRRKKSCSLSRVCMLFLMSQHESAVCRLHMGSIEP